MVEAISIVSAIIGTLGIVGNCVVCIVIGRVPHMHTVTNAFLLNQAVADLLASLMLLLVFNVPEAEALPAGASGWLYCYLWKSECIMWMFLITSAVSLVLVTLERYLAIVYPFKYQALLAWHWVPAAAIAVTWVAGILTGLSIIALVFYSEQEGRCEVSLPTPFEHHYNYLVQLGNFVTFVIPALTMVFAYIHMAIVLKRGARQTQPAPANPVMRLRRRNDGADESAGPVIGNPRLETQGDSLLRARRNVIKTLLLVFLAYLVCWLPNTVMMAANIVGLPYRVATVLAATNSCINPVIYTIKYKSFREGLWMLLRKKRSPTVHAVHI